MVCDGASVTVASPEPGVSVQVAGKRKAVGLELGITTTGGKDMGGNGFNMELGAIKILVKRAASMKIANNPSMERTSQNEIFTASNTSCFFIPSSVSISYF